ncbi:zinc finger protein 2-like [Schistocerca serialis cubense]|uniref:zinc finger protein 2-like n=1 Tax=Schistocerca serialis cubense TaxID=2023355 RepID=UPI00214E1E2A|nr:zinc finger protein 2-like [Schistocerca serialis cubense]
MYVQVLTNFPVKDEEGGESVSCSTESTDWMKDSLGVLNASEGTTECWPQQKDLGNNREIGNGSDEFSFQQSSSSTEHFHQKHRFEGYQHSLQPNEDEHLVILEDSTRMHAPQYAAQNSNDFPSHETFECPRCNSKFISHLSLSEHHCSRGRKVSKEMQILWYRCHQCYRSYARKGSLARHLKFECGRDPQFECSICHQRIKHKSSLVQHMAVKHGLTSSTDKPGEN